MTKKISFEVGPKKLAKWQNFEMHFLQLPKLLDKIQNHCWKDFFLTNFENGIKPFYRNQGLQTRERQSIARITNITRSNPTWWRAVIFY